MAPMEQALLNIVTEMYMEPSGLTASGCSIRLECLGGNTYG
jgi:hypothetical protein